MGRGGDGERGRWGDGAMGRGRKGERVTRREGMEGMRDGEGNANTKLRMMV